MLLKTPIQNIQSSPPSAIILKINILTYQNAYFCKTILPTGTKLYRTIFMIHQIACSGDLYLKCRILRRRCGIKNNIIGEGEERFVWCFCSLPD
ncbi:hypothetical protein CANARDRAFT_96137 [[Candida] arabinofermentans NRRL YB-2248]|uniref:Uncharacterized protein n=1 Tax=[Candida] arabinofermentans NRRL YB-2248 TaxID=983967 RepID=A0A1E4T6V5_9ASCO|nr:hypothetical protein CANARDRAFT_96137 [[Candida] arabinofermentans NRRL YB-2248]